MLAQALRHPDHPLRLAWLFVQALAGSALFASAAYAALYVARDMRSSADVPASGAPAQASFELPPGLVLLLPVDDAAAFQQRTGFAPVLPASLPDGVAPPRYFLERVPEGAPARGRIVYGSRASDAVRIVMIETRADGMSGEADVRAIGGAGAPAFGATRICGGVRVDAQIYFAASDDPGAALQTARAILASICGD
ncbi:MAG TPA: hypothetical protein VFC53_13665 [Dehalococcoidia bacterium]|nr:hypothetical protein [Dehalococcoidia bacterium]